MTHFEIAQRHCPVLMLDTLEPYAPLAFGYSLHRVDGPSPSSKHTITPQGGIVVEYAIWYDWDIQHLYDLEHVWVHVTDGNVIAVSASFHGQRVPMELTDGLPRLKECRPILYAEPGKHAHWADPAAMRLRSGAYLSRVCGDEAGEGGIHRGNPFFAAGAYQITEEADRLARQKMKRDAFVPSFQFEPAVMPDLVSWSDLAAMIPNRVIQSMADLQGKAAAPTDVKVSS